MDDSSATPLVHNSSGLTHRRIYAVLALILACVAYAVVRYNVFGDVSTSSIPMYISNKGIALSAVIFLLAASYCCLMGNDGGSRFWGTASLHASAIHILMSLILFNDTYFEQLYSVDGSLNITGGASTLAGIFAAYFYFVLIQGSARREGIYLLKLFASAFVALHLVIMGLSGWLKVLDWPGRMPPISLLAFAFALGAASLYMAAFLGAADRLIEVAFRLAARVRLGFPHGDIRSVTVGGDCPSQKRPTFGTASKEPSSVRLQAEEALKNRL